MLRDVYIRPTEGRAPEKFCKAKVFGIRKGKHKSDGVATGGNKHRLLRPDAG